MITHTKVRDIAQRIADAVSRTTRPLPTTGDTRPIQADEVYVGVLPIHLRHLHNLLDELFQEAEQYGEQHYRTLLRLQVVRAIFLDALRTQFPSTTGAASTRVLQGGHVVMSNAPHSFKDEEFTELLQIIALGIADST